MKSSLEQTFEKFAHKKNGPSKPKKKRNPPRIASIVGIGLGLVVSLNLCIYLHKTQVLDVRVDGVNLLADQRAQILSESAEKYLKDVWSQISFYTRKPTLAAGLVVADEKIIKATKKSILESIDGAFAVHFVKRGQAAFDDSVKPPIRFTELEMIRNAELRKDTPPEAAKYENRWILNFVAPVPYDANQESIASMILSIELEALQQAIVSDKVSLGEIVLQQKFGANKAVDVLKVGSGSIGLASTKNIPDSFWQIRFTPSYYLFESAKKDVTLVYGVAAIASLLITLLFFVIGRIIGCKVEDRMKEKALLSRAASTSSSEGEADLASPMYQATDILDVDIAKEDEDLLGLEEIAEPVQEELATQEEDVLEIIDDGSIPDVVFRAYDIRGLAKEQITNDLATRVGEALGSEAIDHGQDTLIVARDARLTSPELTEFLIRGIISTGCHVLNIGTVPTPLMYFATSTLKESQSGVMVTASHNPGEYNGFKIVMNGKTRSDDDIKAIRQRILQKNIYEGNGEESRYDVIPEYIDTIFSDVALAGDVTIVIDAANGVTGKVAPQLFEELGCHVIPLFCDLDGSFPNHEPDPSVEKNLQALIAKVKESDADLGVAFDGDGDRLVVVTSSGQIIWPDQLLMMFAKDIVSRNPGADVVFDVKSTRHLASSITSYGGRPIMWKTGHAPMKNKMLETGALLGGEYSGHIFIKDRWFGFDDGMYAAARLIEILSLQGESLDMMFNEFPKSPSTPEIRVPVDEDKKFGIVSQLAALGEFGEGRLTTIDGVRVDFPNGWGLVRASNTSANLTLRFEADDEDALHQVKSIMVKELKKIDNSITIDWEA